MISNTPQFSATDAVKLVTELYGMSTTATKLAGERDLNFSIATIDGGQYVLKIANVAEDRALLEAQNAIMQTLVAIEETPSVIPTKSGDRIADVQASNGDTHFVRLLTWRSGIPMALQAHHSDALLQDIGRVLGQLNWDLADFDHPALHRAFDWDLANGVAVVRKYESLIQDQDMRMLVGGLTAQFEETVVPLLPQLRQSVIQSDANDYNVIVGSGKTLYDRNQQVTGLIDFGDAIYTHTINELAIACAYAVLDKPDPLATAREIVRGYHHHNPLTEAELAALFGLITLRLCVSVCMAAQQQAQRPDDDYLSISQQPIRNTLPKLAQIAPRLAEAVFRDACGMEPSKNAAQVRAFLKANTANFAPIIPQDLRTEPVIVLDWSVSSPLLKGDPHADPEPVQTARIMAKMAAAGVEVSVGQHDEPRLVYASDAFTSGSDPFDERRTIHLGIDLFGSAGTPVYAPLKGVVVFAVDNNALYDYGPVIILAHATDEGIPFFTLYGHLSRESLEDLTPGMPIATGQQIATYGEPAVNGGWSPHVHFQVITDLLGMGNDFPGVGYASQRNVWNSLSPDPNLILGIPLDYFPTKETHKAETQRVRKAKLGGNLSLGYRDHLKIVRGWRQYLFDETARRYLDAYNNVPHVGHCHPHVVEAAQRQYGILNTNTRYLHDLLNQYAERLSATLSDPLSVCYFVNSGSEATDLALRLARAATGQKDVIVLDGAYHGHTNTLIDISPYKHDGPGGLGAPDWVQTAPVADVYRGQYKATDPNAGRKYAAHVQDNIDAIHAQGRGLSAYIAESCPSVGGQIIFPEHYLQAVYKAVRAAGGVCIADEVQTGYGRIGTHMYAFEAQNVTPDIVVLGKPIGNGHPIGAVVTTPEIAAAFDNGMEFFSTFGGSTVSCAAGLAVLDVVQQQNVMAHANEVGQRLLAGLAPLKDKYALVGDVRGAGLFLGIELVRDRATLDPAAREASYVSNRMREHGILMGTDGPLHNVVKIRPPMPFNADNADWLVSVMDKVLGEIG